MVPGLWRRLYLPHVQSPLQVNTLIFYSRKRFTGDRAHICSFASIIFLLFSVDLDARQRGNGNCPLVGERN